MKITILKTIFILAVVLLFSQIAIAQFHPTTAPATQRLSDRETTEGNIDDGYLKTAVSDSAVHIAWVEETGTSEGYDAYYRALPSGTTKNLSNHTLTEGAVAFWENIAATPNGDVAVVWLEDTGTNEGFDFFLWRSTTGATTDLSDHSLTEADTWLYGKPLFDENGQVHVIFTEGEEEGELELFYWSETAGITQPISQIDNAGSKIKALVYAVEGTTAYTFNGHKLTF